MCRWDKKSVPWGQGQMSMVNTTVQATAKAAATAQFLQVWEQ